MADVCSHQDEARKGVSATAHAVAIMRAMEPIIHGENAWFNDPYALALGGDVGKNWVQKRKEEKNLSEAEGNVRLDWMAIRTRKIDEEMSNAINVDNYRQILSEANAVTPFDYHKVIADLSLPGWADTLTAAGFDPAVPTLWLLEGFIGYLKEDEANALFATLTHTLSARGSRIVATLGSNRHRGNDLHCFFPPDPLAWLNSHSWQGRQWEIHQLAEQYGRPLPGEAFDGYYIMVAEL